MNGVGFVLRNRFTRDRSLGAMESSCASTRMLERRHEFAGAGRGLIVSDIPDHDLVLRSAKGDKVAFTQLVDRHRVRLLALVSRTLGNRAIAEDIVQDVFIRAWTHAPSWQARDSGRASYAAWLSRVAVNLAIDQARKVRPVALESVAEPEDPATQQDDTMVAAERAQQIRQAISGLPERQRIALSLTYDAGLSNADGAQAMEISVGAFELLLVRARRTLRQTLSEE